VQKKSRAHLLNDAAIVAADDDLPLISHNAGPPLIEQLPQSAVSYTVNGFCALHRISRWKFFQMRAEGIGPRELAVGRTIRISAQANIDWVKAREGPSGTAARLLERERKARAKAASKAGKVAGKSPKHHCRRGRQRAEA